MTTETQEQRKKRDRSVDRRIFNKACKIEPELKRVKSQLFDEDILADESETYCRKLRWIKYYIPWLDELVGRCARNPKLRSAEIYVSVKSYLGGYLPGCKHKGMICAVYIVNHKSEQ